MHEGWRYYNHAAIPTSAPHEEANMEPIESGRIWKMFDGKSPLMARWTSDFDCQYETNWWYLIREKPFVIDSLEKKCKKHINQALRKCTVTQLNPCNNIDDLYRVYQEASKRYQKQDNFLGREAFDNQCIEECNTGFVFWGAYIEDNLLIGYMVTKQYEMYAQISIAKFSANYLRYRASDALYATVLDYYLNKMELNYVSSGERSINHITGTQEYKERVFNYRKAYCHVNICYRPGVKILLKVASCFSKILRCFDKNVFIHQINSIIEMDEIVRNNQKY